MPTPKKKIIFTEDVRVLNHSKAVEFEAKAGEVKELTTSSANRWLRRNVASEDIQGLKKVVKEAEAIEKEIEKEVEVKEEKKPATRSRTTKKVSAKKASESKEDDKAEVEE